MDINSNKETFYGELYPIVTMVISRWYPLYLTIYLTP